MDGGKMKKVFVLLSITMVLVLAGCSSSGTEEEQTLVDTTISTDADGTIAIPQGMQDATEVTQLLFGTLMLEGTDRAVTPEQAAELLPLWKLYRSLLESDISAAAEIEAVAKKLSQAMTAEQLAAMENQAFDREQMSAIMEDLGVEMTRGTEGEGGNFTPPEGIAPPDGFAPGEGGAPGGGGRGDGSGPGGGTGINPEMMATRQARMETEVGGFQRGFNLPLVEALIELLEGRIG
jgi:hypothetical protein